MLFKIYSCGWGADFSLHFLPLVACEWSRKGVGDVDDDRCPGLAGMAPASEVVAAEVSGFISFSHSVAVVSVFSSLSLVLLCP